jgi:hypothetical protein
MTMQSNSPALDPVETRKMVLHIAGDVGCDVRTVHRVLRGESVRGHVAARIRHAVEAYRAELKLTA